MERETFAEKIIAALMLGIEIELRQDDDLNIEFIFRENRSFPRKVCKIQLSREDIKNSSLTKDFILSDVIDKMMFSLKSINH